MRRIVLRLLDDSDGGDRVGVHEQRHRRAEGEGGVRPSRADAGQERARRLAGGLVDRRHLLLGGAEDVVPAADLSREVDHRDDDDEVDQDVLHERDHRRGAQAAGVGEGRQHGERDEERRVLGDDVVATTDAGHLEHGLDADELERDVGHRRHEAGHRDGQREAPAVVASADEVGRRHVAVAVADRPQPGHEDEDDRVEHDRVGDGEEARHRSRGEHRRRHRDERVRGVEVATEQEPRDPRAELATAETPLVQRLERLTALEARGHEAGHGDQQEQDDQHAQGDSVDPAVGGHHGHLGRHRSSPTLCVVLPRADRVSL